MPEIPEEELCESCGHEGVPTKEYKVLAPMQPGDTGIKEYTRHYCEVCASTYLSKSVDYSHLCEERNLASSLGWIGNEILLNLKRLERKITRIPFPHPTEPLIKIELSLKQWLSVWSQLPMESRWQDGGLKEQNFSLEDEYGNTVHFVVGPEE